MAPGALWYLRLADPHRVTDAGTSARVHLVIDVLANRWLDVLLDAASTAAGTDAAVA